ncbi:ABC transporter permease [Limnohabitans sp. DM1]|uniref:ABC transporter permease n=1 Tax=Limnohabitans sp. DM1 TaxID=1597955 RepID=UPI000B13F36C|nr:ABC transporter permease [Limnohabitans sp. DM1]
MSLRSMWCSLARAARLCGAVARKEWLQLRQDRLTLALLAGVPLAQILLFGFAISLAPKHWPAAWVLDSSPPAASSMAPDPELDRRLTQAMLQHFQEGRLLALQAQPMSAQEATLAMQRGDVRLVLHWPASPSTYVLAGQALPVRLEADLSDPWAQAVVSQWGDSLSWGLARAARQPAAAQLMDWQGLPVRVQMQGRYALTEQDGAYMMPALSGVILTLTLTLMAALCVVRELERGTWDALRTTPLTAGHIVVGKLLPYLLLGLAQYALLQAMAWALFGTPWASVALWFLALVFMLGQLGLGLCLSLLARQQLQAVQLGIFFYLPSLLLSGFMFPLHAMPQWARTLAELLPLTHFLRAMRAELFRHAEPAQVFSLGWPVLLFAATVLTASWVGYRRRLA